MTSETFLLTLLLTSLLTLLLAFWLMTKSLNKATHGLISTTLETTTLLSQTVHLLAVKDPIAYQQIAAANGTLVPSQDQAVLVTDNYPEVDEDDYDFDAIRKEYGVQ
jgi:hypothetical protein